ncbi:hypothetical protein GGR57DRAFT_393576 [Xylariaceae sp. FL1272]|nr:hypothetical protein GGR57DRAFT_393576 [Xylariaceae sp. FL1272]
MFIVASWSSTQRITSQLAMVMAMALFWLIYFEAMLSPSVIEGGQGRAGPPIDRRAAPTSNAAVFNFTSKTQPSFSTSAEA